MQNRTADLLLTMETLYRLSYRGQSIYKATALLKAAQIGPVLDTCKVALACRRGAES